MAFASAVSVPTYSAASQMVTPTCGQAIAHTISSRRAGAAKSTYQGLRSSSCGGGKAAQAFSSSPSSPTSNSNRRSLSVVCEATGTATSVGAVTDESFKSLVLDSDVPVVVDFWAPWCGPCRMIEPLIGEIAAQFGPKIKVLKLNTDESPATATEYGIRSIPTVMLFKKGKKVDTIIGAVPKGTLTSTIEKYL